MSFSHIFLIFQDEDTTTSDAQKETILTFFSEFPCRLGNLRTQGLAAR